MLWEVNGSLIIKMEDNTHALSTARRIWLYKEIREPWYLTGLQKERKKSHKQEFTTG